jgi:hypothetical protein
MKIRLNTDYTVALDGINPTSFRAGTVVDNFPRGVVDALLSDGRASLVTDIERKEVVAAPKNKATMKAPEPPEIISPALRKAARDAKQGHYRKSRR